MIAETGDGRRARRLDLALAVALAAGAVLVHLQVLGHALLVHDDNVLLPRDEPGLLAGLTREGVRWAWTSHAAGNWIPLTRLSWLLDVSLFGHAAPAFLGGNLVYHALATAFLFAALRALGAARAPSAGVAAIFAVHPAHVESVAWAAERRDVLFGALWMAALWAYAGYARRPGLARYAAVLVLAGLSLLAKPMAVTLPCVLLLLDAWPLGRLPWDRAGDALRALPRLVLEKLPIAGLAAAVSVAAVRAQDAAGALTDATVFPLPIRAANAALAYLQYVRIFLWPVRLSPFHPHPGPNVSFPAAGVAAALLALSVALAWRARRARPWLAVGWLFYLGTLVPVIGLVQVGSQAYADRYLYVPLVGLSIVAVYGALEIAERLRVPVAARRAAAAAVLLALASLSWIQVGFWRDSEALFTRALALDPDNWLARHQLGVVALERGDLDTAAAHFAEALRIEPKLAKARAGYAEVLARQGKLEAAIAAYREALAIEPSLPGAAARVAELAEKAGRPEDAIRLTLEALRQSPGSAELEARLGDAYFRARRFDEAVPPLEAAIRLKPDLPGLHRELGIALLSAGEAARAEPVLREALRREPAEPTLHFFLGDALARTGRSREAAAAYREALRLRPGWPEVENDLAWILATDADPGLRAPAEAVALAEHAVAATSRGNASLLDTLVVAYAAAGRQDAAREAARQAVELARSGRDPAALEAAEARLREVESGGRAVERGVRPATLGGDARRPR